MLWSQTRVLIGLSDLQQEMSSRRWSSLQSRDFGSLHATLATLILNCDVSHAYTEGELIN